MRKLSLFACTLLLAGASFAQTPASTTDADGNRAAARPDERADNNNFGWIGLLGLAGLAGLKRREREVHNVEHDRNRENIRRAS